jgi:hypothetical protein
VHARAPYLGKTVFSLARRFFSCPLKSNAVHFCALLRARIAHEVASIGSEALADPVSRLTLCAARIDAGTARSCTTATPADPSGVRSVFRLSRQTDLTLVRVSPAGGFQSSCSSPFTLGPAGSAHLPRPYAADVTSHHVAIGSGDHRRQFLTGTLTLYKISEWCLV